MAGAWTEFCLIGREFEGIYSRFSEAKNVSPLRIHRYCDYIDHQLESQNTSLSADFPIERLTTQTADRTYNPPPSSIGSWV